MRYLPLSLTTGPLLTQVIREARRDPRRQGGLCSCCGARIYVPRPERPDLPVRCPACLRVQRVETDTEAPWRLTDASAEALRQTKSWPRRY